MIAILTLLVGGSLLAACGGGAELSIIRSFFRASRYDDRAALANVSMVAFDRQEDGIANNLSVDSVTEERRRALRLRDLAAALEEVRARDEEFRDKKNAYQNENFEAIRRVIEAERVDADVAGNDQTVQLAWTTWLKDERVSARQVSDAQNELNDESRVTAASAYDPDNPIDVAQYEGELVSKDVTVTATITKDGSSSERWRRQCQTTSWSKSTESSLRSNVCSRIFVRMFRRSNATSKSCGARSREARSNIMRYHVYGNELNSRA